LAFLRFKKVEKNQKTANYTLNIHWKNSTICRFKVIALCIFNENAMKHLTGCIPIDSLRFFLYNNNDVNFL